MRTTFPVFYVKFGDVLLWLGAGDLVMYIGPQSQNPNATWYGAVVECRCAASAGHMTGETLLFRPLGDGWHKVVDDAR